jgi:hypothetical protein
MYSITDCASEKTLFNQGTKEREPETGISISRLPPVAALVLSSRELFLAQTTAQKKKTLTIPL